MTYLISVIALPSLKSCPAKGCLGSSFYKLVCHQKRTGNAGQQEKVIAGYFSVVSGVKVAALSNQTWNLDPIRLSNFSWYGKSPSLNIVNKKWLYFLLNTIAEQWHAVPCYYEINNFLIDPADPQRPYRQQPTLYPRISPFCFGTGGGFQESLISVEETGEATTFRGSPVGKASPTYTCRVHASVKVIQGHTWISGR